MTPSYIHARLLELYAERDRLKARKARLGHKAGQQVGKLQLRMEGVTREAMALELQLARSV